MNRFSKIAVIVLSVGPLAGASARAGEASVSVDRVSVFYGDIDLSTQTGAPLLLARIKQAADEACGGKPDIRDIAGMDSFHTCAKAAMDIAVKRLGNAKVAALYGQTIEQVASRN